MAWRMLSGLSSYSWPWASQLLLCASSLPSRQPTRRGRSSTTRRALLRTLAWRSRAARLDTPCRAPSRIRKRREKRRRLPPTQVVLLRAQMLAAAQLSRLPCLRLFPPNQTSGKLKGKKCGSIATTAAWCSARTIGFTFGRTFSSGIESPFPSPIPSPLGHPSTAASVSGATTAAKSISINPQKCSNPNWSFLTLSLRIRYFEIFRGWWEQTHAAFLPRRLTLSVRFAPRRQALMVALRVPLSAWNGSFYALVLWVHWSSRLRLLFFSAR